METALDALARLGSNYKLLTGVSGVDELLGGGVGLAEMVEVVGAFATGKTQFLYSISSHYLINQPANSMVWIDLNGSFRAERLLQFMQTQDTSSLERCFVNRVYDAAGLLDAIDRLTISLPSTRLRLLIIDNIGSILQKTAWTLRNGGDGAQLQRCCLVALQGLQKLGVTVVMSNHLVTVNGSSRPALGKQWKDLVKNRLLVDKDHRSFLVKDYKNPAASPSSVARFKVTDRGLLHADGLSMSQ